jgi:GNAT superfamily N-acetyltransferase
MLPNHVFSTYFFPDVFPPEAVELLGSEPGRAWESAAVGGPGQVPVLIGATTDGQWLAGMLLILETLEKAGTQRLAGANPVEHVASIKLLVVSRQYQNAGLAGFLIRRAGRLAVEQSCSRLRTTAGFGCTDHVLMYERLGFTRGPVSDRPYLMTKALTAAV